MAAPTITTLPPAPQRQQAAADFSTTANAHVASLATFVSEANTQGTFNDDQTVLASDSASAAATKETEATASANNASGSADNAASHENSTLVAAAAAQSSAGLPSLTGNAKKALKVSANELEVEWGDTGLVGDVTFASDAALHTSPEFLECDGSLYNTTTYADLYNILGDFPVKLADPASLPYASGRTVEYSDNGVYLSVGSGSSQYLRIYKRSGDILTLLANPTGGMPADTVSSTSWGFGDTYLAVTQRLTSPYVKVYKRTADTFAKLPDLVTGGVIGYSSDFSPDGTYLAVVGDGGDRVVVFKRSGDTFTALSSPASLPLGSSPSDVKWSRSGDYLAIANGLTPFLNIYKRSGDVLTLLSSPASLPTGGCTGVSWGLNDEFLTFAHNVTPFMTTFSRSGDVFTKIADPGVLLTGDVASCEYSDSGKYLAFGAASGTSPGIQMYQQESGVFTKMPSPASTPSRSRGVSFGADDDYLAASDTSSPYVYNYSIAANLPDIDTGDAITPTLAYIKTGL